MNDFLFYDTETTGFPLYNQPSNDPRQPHIVQLAWSVLRVEPGKWKSTDDPAPEEPIINCYIIRPDGWTIPEESSAIHGITQERAMDEGIPESEVLHAFLDDWQKRPRVAHNESFDARIIRIGIRRFVPGEGAVDGWAAGAAYCTMNMARPLVKALTAAGKPKPPKLSEAYRHFYGSEMDGAHTADGDVRACIAIFRRIYGAKR